MEHIAFENGVLYALDQRALPVKEEVVALRTVEDVAEAIRTLLVRGAPLIGVSAAYGMAISAAQNAALDADSFREALRADARLLAGTRPTAVNLFWALDRCEREILRELDENGGDTRSAARFAQALAEKMHREDVELCRRIGENGATLLFDGARVLTHCNAGALATAGYGTALGVLRAAREQGMRLKVYADETRPLLQGARLTAYELYKDGFDVTLLCDNMAATLLRDGKIDRVIVGADRIAANGDTANKIGTYGLSVLCKAHGVPMTIAAPLSTIDASIETGAQIPIENRAGEEVGHFFGVQTAPEGISFYNPAFDVTPWENIDAIVTECGVLRPPFAEKIRALFAQKDQTDR